MNETKRKKESDLRETPQMALSRMWSPLEVLYALGRATMATMTGEDGGSVLVIILPDVAYDKSLGLKDERESNEK